MGAIARIATLCQAKKFHGKVEENRAYMMERLDTALRCKPDLVCLPEAFASLGVPQKQISKIAESLPGPTTDAAAKRARQGNCYVICPVVIQRQGLYWNSAVVIARDGSIIGVYDKMHPVTTTPDYTEFESGTHPGSAASVFKLDFGIVGIQICFDIQFPEGWASLAAQGAKIVFWPSAYNGGFPLQAYAWHHHYYVVSSVQTDQSRIINPLGKVLTQTDELLNFVWQDINLDYVVCHTDFNYDIPEWLIERYPGKVAVHLLSDEGHFLVEPLVENLTIASLKQEFGFISVEEYNNYHREAFNLIHTGGTPIHQPALHGKRPMYVKTGGRHE